MSGGEWQQFLATLETKNITFEQVKGATDRVQLISSLGFVDPLQIAIIETEWKRRVGAYGDPNSNMLNAAPAVNTNTPAPGSAPYNANYSNHYYYQQQQPSMKTNVPPVTTICTTRAEQVRLLMQQPQQSLEHVPEELQDVILSNEVLSASLGFGGNYIQKSKNGFIVNSLVPPSMRHLCETILPVADAFLLLQQVEKTECVAKSLVAMALGEVVAEICTSYAHEITKLQRWSEDKAMPLMGVVSEVLRVGQYVVRLRQVLPMDLLLQGVSGSSATSHHAELQSSLVGKRILDHISEQGEKFTGSKQDEELRALLLRRALVPYLRMLHRWMHEGVLEDPFGEFFILEVYEPQNRSSRMDLITSAQRRHVMKLFPEAITTNAIGSGGNSYGQDCNPGQQEVLAFERRFSMSKRMIPSFLEKPSRVSKMIFFAGKYCCLLREFNNTLPAFGEVSENMLVWSDIDDLHRKIQETFELASRAVIQLLFSPNVDLLGHVHSLKSYFLQSRGDWVVDFLDSAEDLLSQSTNSVKVHSIRVLLQAAIARACRSDMYHDLIGCSFSSMSLEKIIQKQLSGNKNNEGSVDTRASGRKSVSMVSSESCVDLMQLEVDLEWPLTLVLDSNVLQKLNSVFRLLMSVKVCERRLCDIFNVNEVLSTFSAAYGIKQQLIQFFRQFQFYASHFVLEPSWEQLTRQIGQADSVFAISQAFQSFFETVERGLLLSSLRRFKSLTKIIDISNRLCEVGLHSNSATMPLIESTLHNIEDGFQKALVELASPNGPDYAQLVPLFTWIDFNGFYARNNIYHVQHGFSGAVS